MNGKSYMLMSPYPGQSSPISLQSWGHRLEIDKADDDRIDQFITALNQNPNVYPEVGASCTNPLFTPSTSPFDPTPPGADAIQMDGTGATPATDEQIPAGG
ncbi:hypothetical protein D9M68_925030 [compost metagenome]